MCGQLEQPLLDYFETNYVGELRRGRRNPPLFAHEMWNMNGRVANNLPRTNNYLDGWHNRFCGMVNHAHPNIRKFLEMFRREATHNEMVMAQILGGANPPPQKRAYRDVTIRIQNLVQNYKWPMSSSFCEEFLKTWRTSKHMLMLNAVCIMC